MTQFKGDNQDANQATDTLTLVAALNISMQ